MSIIHNELRQLRSELGCIRECQDKLLWILYHCASFFYGYGILGAAPFPSLPDYFTVTTNGQVVLFKSFHSFIHIHSSIHFGDIPIAQFAARHFAVRSLC